jgi:predicted dehydrogenase
MGLVHAERIVTDGRGEIVAFCDADARRASALGAQLAPDAGIYVELALLLAETLPDAVLICTPTDAHCDDVAACQAAGVHVLCEKPLADSRDRIDRLVAAAEHSAAQHAIAYQRRSWATFRTLRREVLSGRWGPVRAVSLQVSEGWQQTIAGTWRDDPQANFGGFVGDAGSHKLDAVFFVTGLAPREVFARSWTCGSRVPVLASVSAVLGDDVPLTVSFVGNGQVLSEVLHVYCVEAELSIRDGRAWIARGNQVESLLPLEPDANPVTTFFDVLDGVAENCAPFSCARPVFDLTAAIQESAASGRNVEIDTPPTN